MSDYIQWIRSQVGHAPIILNFAGACIVNDQNEILLQKRADVDLWGLPGGAIELGESIAEAAIREVKEETGLEINVHELVGVYSKYFTYYKNGDEAQSILYVFNASVIGGKLCEDNEETRELVYFKQDALPPLFVTQHVDVIQDFFNNKRGVFK